MRHRISIIFLDYAQSIERRETYDQKIRMVEAHLEARGVEEKLKWVEVIFENQTKLVTYGFQSIEFPSIAKLKSIVVIGAKLSHWRKSVTKYIHEE